jgi:protein SCO1
MTQHLEGRARSPSGPVRRSAPPDGPLGERALPRATLHVLLALALALGCSSCKDKAPDSPVPTTAAAATNVQVYQVAGVVQELKPDGTNVVIAHQEITNYMPAMTMQFRVRDTNELRGLSPGDNINFRMFVTDEEGWIANITRTGKQTPPAAAPPTEAAAAAVETADVGDVLPDLTLTNEFGKAITLSEFRGQALAFTFIFTRCPYPEFCPRMTTQFHTIAQQLAAQPNGPTNWHLLSISFDPEHDTPEVLKGYAERYHYDPAHWSFATGSPKVINLITRICGLMYQADAGTIAHNLRTVVADANGRITTLLPGNTWTADALAEALTKAAAVPIEPARKTE